MWHRRMEFEFLNPMITIFVHTGEMWKGRVTQIPELAEVTRANMQASMEWLDKELEGKEFIAGDTYTVADITAQCAFVMGKAALGIRDSRITGESERLVAASLFPPNSKSIDFLHCSFVWPLPFFLL
jgi:glutathione S-transferase